MVRADDQQHLVALVPQPVHRLDHARRIGIGLAQHRQMLGRAQRPQMLRGIRLAHPEDRQRRLAVDQHLADEPLGHAPLAGCVLGNVERLRALDALAARRERAGAVIDVAVTVRVVGKGRPRRHVGEHDHAAMRREPLGQRRDGQRPAGDAALVLEEIRVAGVVVDEAAVFQQRQRVALQLMPRGVASRRERGRDDARRRGEHRAVRGKALRPVGKAHEARRGSLADQIPAHAIEDDDNGSAHEFSPCWRLGSPSAPSG